MNQREKEQYLSEYQLLKAEGKPFFPYSVFKDSVMMLVALAVMILMSLALGADLGPRADPTTTSYIPRPEWYFYFLFELLRVIKPPQLLILATIGIPTIGLLLLLMLPFFDRSPRRNPIKRPVAMSAMVVTAFAMAYLTYLGASAGSPIMIEMEVPASQQAGKEAIEQAGCLACHKLKENGNKVGPNLDAIAVKLNKAAIVRTISTPVPPMPSYADMPLEKRRQIADFITWLKESNPK